MIQSETPRGDFDELVARNIRALVDVRRQTQAQRTWKVRVADAITAFAGSMTSVLAHTVLFGGWVVVNLGVVPGLEPWDPFPFVMLAALASVEAIYLTTFVLISQNRQEELNEERAELDLQVSLLGEHEVTRLIAVVDRIAERLGVERPPDIEALKQDIRPEQVMEDIARARDED